MVVPQTVARVADHGRRVSPRAHSSNTDGPRTAAQLQGVTAGYVEDLPVVTNLDVTVPASGMVRLHGPNGTGKSTVIELLSGYLRPWAGEVRIFGESAAGSRARSRRRIVRTNPALFEYLSLRDHLSVFAKANGDDLSRLVARAERLGLGAWLETNGGGLSSGTAKKAWYVLCSSGDPDLLVLDEPFNAVDDAGVAIMVDELREHVERGATVLVVCHTLPAGLDFDDVIALTPEPDVGPHETQSR